jgi:prepilin-type processing-associated H-X9-DG protein
MADRPPPEGIANNSINHGGAGQNVLFADGHAVFLTSRMFAGADDIFANNAGKVAAGLDPRDIVLGHSAARP